MPKSYLVGWDQSPDGDNLVICILKFIGKDGYEVEEIMGVDDRKSVVGVIKRIYNKIDSLEKRVQDLSENLRLCGIYVCPHGYQDESDCPDCGH